MKGWVAGSLVGLVIGGVFGFTAKSWLYKNELETNADRVAGIELPPSESMASTSTNLTSPELLSTRTESSVAQTDRNSVNSNNASAQNTSVNQSIPQPTSPLSLSDFNSSLHAPRFSEIKVLIDKISVASYSEMEALVTQTLNMPNNHEAGFLIPMLFSRMYEMDPQSTMGLVSAAFEKGVSQANVYQYSEIVKLLAETNGDELLAMLDSSSVGLAKHELQNMVYAGMARSDPERALTLANENANTAMFGGQYDALQEWARQDPSAAMQWLMNQDLRGDERHGYFSVVFSQWASSDYEQASAFLSTLDDSSLDPGVKEELELSLMHVSAQNDPQAALDHALSLGDEQSRQSALYSTLQVWAMNNPQDAIDYVTYNLSGTDQVMGYNILGSTVSYEHFVGRGKSVSEALNAMQSLPDELRQPLQMQSVGYLFNEDPAGILAYVESLPDENERNQLLSSFAYNIPDYDLSLAMDLFARSGPETRQMLTHGIGRQLYLQNPQEAIQWMESLPEYERSQALYPMIEQISMDNPDEAMRLATQFGSESDEAMAGMVFYSLLANSPNKAKQWLEQSNISEDMRNRMNQMLEGMEPGSMFSSDIYFQGQ